MPYLKGKPTKAQRWLPSQVLYGMDVSDPDPANWKPFGQIADELREKADLAAAKNGAKGHQLDRS